MTQQANPASDLSWIEKSSNGILLRLQIQHRASKTEIIGLHGIPPRLKVRIAAPPVDGEANEELNQFLKKKLGVPASQLLIVKGTSSKLKDVICNGISLETALQVLLKERESL